MSEVRDAPISSTILHRSGGFTVGVGSIIADLRGMFGKMDRFAPVPVRLGITLILAICCVVILLEVLAMRVLFRDAFSCRAGGAPTAFLAPQAVVNQKSSRPSRA